MRDSYNEAIQISKATDVAQFKLVVSRYEGKVAGVVHSLITDSNLAEDIGQKAFLSLYDSQSKFPRNAPLSKYLIRQAIDLCKNVKRENIISQHDGPKDISEKLQFKFLQLNLELQLVVILRLIEGYSMEETADILNERTGTILSRLANAQHELRLEVFKRSSSAGLTLSDKEVVLLKSMDARVDRDEQIQLNNLLKEDSSIRGLNDQYQQLREMLHRKDKATFGPFFPERIAHAIDQRRENIDFLALSFFKKYQLLILGVLVALFILNLVVAEDFSLKAIFGLDQETTEEVFSIDVYKNLPQ